MPRFICAVTRAAVSENRFYVTYAHSGYNVARHRLLAHRTPARPVLYDETIGPLVSQRVVLDAVLDGPAEVAPVDSYLLDLRRRHLPDVTARVRVVATTEPVPSAPATPCSREARVT
jgi:hypothetical protein